MWYSWENVKSVFSVLGAIGTIVTAWAIFNAKAFSPLVARPIAKAIKGEIGDMVENTVKDSPAVKESFRSVVKEELEPLAAEMHSVDEMMSNITGSLTTMKGSLTHIKNRLKRVEDNLGLDALPPPPIPRKRRVVIHK